MKILPSAMKGERIVGVNVLMERNYPFSLPSVFHIHQNVDFPYEKKRGQNLTYRLHFSKPYFDTSRDSYEHPVLENGYCEMQIGFGSGALKSGQKFTNKVVGLKLEKILSKLLKFAEEHKEDLAAYMTFGHPLASSPKLMLSLIAKERNEYWSKNLRKDHKHNRERVHTMIKDLRKDIVKAQSMQGKTGLKIT